MCDSNWQLSNESGLVFLLQLWTLDCIELTVLYIVIIISVLMHLLITYPSPSSPAPIILPLPHG